MNLGVNPLLQFGLDATREQLIRNILDDISIVNYVPFDTDTIGNPALDLGDVLSFSGGQADSTKYACITSNSIKIGGKQTLKCVGKNPKLSQAKSKNDKNISGLLNQILGTNPMGTMYKAAGSYDDLIVWNDNLLPICPNMIGGILLFPSAINEAVDNIYLPSTNLPVAYASNDVNATANTRRGSMNLTESMALTNGYKFVWEFTASQGNGTIAAIGLTSKQGGANAYS